MATGIDTQRAPLTDDDRFDLQYAASASERRNQPRALVLGAAALLALALLSVLFGQGALSNAKENIARERARQTEITQLIAQLESSDEQSHTQIYEHDDRAKLNIHNATKNAGLTNTTKEPRSEVNPMGDGVQRIKYIYDASNSLKAPLIETLMDAVDTSLNSVPGLEVMSINLKLSEKEWSMNITYTRMEKAN